jgi:hypothetical protein
MSPISNVEAAMTSGGTIPGLSLKILELGLGIIVNPVSDAGGGCRIKVTIKLKVCRK